MLYINDKHICPLYLSLSSSPFNRDNVFHYLIRTLIVNDSIDLVAMPKILTVLNEWVSNVKS